MYRASENIRYLPCTQIMASVELNMRHHNQTTNEVNTVNCVHPLTIVVAVFIFETMLEILLTVAEKFFLVEVSNDDCCVAVTLQDFIIFTV